MSLNDKKLISIIQEQASEVEERCNGYREEIISVIVAILEYERLHREQASNIQQKINDKCNAVARFLTENRGENVAERAEQ